MREKAMKDKPIVGIDVSKGWLDLCIAGNAKVERLANDEKAIGAWLDRVRPAVVAFEPTGGYERALIAALRARAILFVRVHPNDVIAFRKSRGIKAKTDRIDAQLIAAFAAEELVRRGMRPTILGNDLLRALAARRSQLASALHAERCRLALATEKPVRQNLELMIATLGDSLDAIEADIAKAIDRDPQTAQLAKLLRTVQGIGPVTAATLIADLPELGLLSAKEIASLVGLAPNTRQSGKARPRAPTSHGRPHVRQVLFNAARAALRHPSPFKDFADRLVTLNKRPGKVAITAVMRKLLVTANAIARDRQPWKLHKA
jgi:transposase